MNSDLKAAIVRTAQYVQENGSKFEEKLSSDLSGRFEFMKPDNEHYAFYQSVLKNMNPNEGDGENSQIVDQVIPEEPPLFVFSQYDRNGSIPEVDLEIIKRTAEFWVMHDETVSDRLKQRFADSEKFHFLKPDHTLNPIFVQFINQYKQILESQNDNTVEQTQQELLARCFQRATFDEYKKQLLSDKERLMEEYKIEYSAIDWADFITVERITQIPTEEEYGNPLKEALDFSTLRQKRISGTSLLDFLNEYFELKDSKDAKLPKNNQSVTNGKKRKQKLVIKESGHTRLNKRKKKN